MLASLSCISNDCHRAILQSQQPPPSAMLRVRAAPSGPARRCSLHQQYRPFLLHIPGASAVRGWRRSVRWEALEGMGGAAAATECTAQWSGDASTVQELTPHGADESVALCGACSAANGAALPMVELHSRLAGLLPSASPSRSHQSTSLRRLHSRLASDRRRDGCWHPMRCSTQLLSLTADGCSQPERSRSSGTVTLPLTSCFLVHVLRQLLVI
jgi:hypothetical protein